MTRATDLLLYVVIAACLVMGGYQYGAHKATAAAAVAEQARTAKAVQAQRNADAAVLADERALRSKDADTFNTYKEAHAHADEKTEQLVTDLRAGNRRLRIPLEHPICPTAPDGNPSPAAGTLEQGSAELGSDASVFVVGLLERGDDAIRKHAAVVDLYDHLRTACAAPAETVAAPAE